MSAVSAVSVVSAVSAVSAVSVLNAVSAVSLMIVVSVGSAVKKIEIETKRRKPSLDRFGSLWITLEKQWAMRFVFGVLESERKRSDAGGGDSSGEAGMW